MDDIERELIREWLDPERVDHAIRVMRDVIETKKRFNLCVWISYETPGRTCGTSACMMGWMGQDDECRRLGLRVNAGGVYFSDNGATSNNEVSFFLKREKFSPSPTNENCFLIGHTPPYCVTDAISRIVFVSAYGDAGHIDEDTDWRDDVSPEEVLGRLLELRDVLL